VFGIMLTRPREVVWAVSLLWLSLALWFFTSVVNWAYGGNSSPDVILFLMDAFIIWKISQRKSWARILFLILVLGGALLFLIFARTVRTAIPWSVPLALVFILQNLIQIAALILLFTRPATKWFKA
jgi:hypothetical protein